MEQNNLYLQRINLVTDYIRQHLTDDLSLNVLAEVAGFSPFHFHRIFKTITGETLADITLRLRLERAAALLRATPGMPIARAAESCGFSSPEVFSRAFKKHFGLAPRTWNRQQPLRDSKNHQVFDTFPRYTIEQLGDDTGEFEVRLRELPAMRLAYIRVVNSYQPERTLAAYQRLINWGLARGGARSTLIGMSQDDPDVTPLELYRYDWCLTAPESWAAEGEISLRDFPACHIAYIHCCGDIYAVDRAWQYLFRSWLPRSRFQPDNLPALEIFRRRPDEIGWEQWDLDCAIPVIAL